MHGPVRRFSRLVIVTATITLAGAPTSATATAAEQPVTGFQYLRVGSPALVDATRWVLQGKKQRDGSCDYQYPSQERELPENGWVLRSIGINTSTCTKLMEEGSPAEPLALSADPAGGTSTSTSLPTLSKSGSDNAQGLAATSTRGAWQLVSWLDIASLKTSWDHTQIYWTYNGTSVLSGNTAGRWWWLDFTGWRLVAGSNVISQRFESDGAFRGQTKATMRNPTFCAPFPTTYTYYYYNRVYGHANGTATISQSSDSVNDCVALHVDIVTAYN
jgi:hypothetical protein